MLPLATIVNILLDHIFILLDPVEPGLTSVDSSIWFSAILESCPPAVKKLFQLTGSEPPGTFSQFSNPPFCICCWAIEILAIKPAAIISIDFFIFFFLIIVVANVAFFYSGCKNNKKKDSKKTVESAYDRIFKSFLSPLCKRMLVCIN